jgi:tetratricopeptide (TPR) repeat protein
VVWWRPAWPAALLLGLGLHLGVELVGLEIGLFSYLMFAVYLLVLPEQVFGSSERSFGPAVRRALARVPRLLGWLAGAVMLGALLWSVPLPFGLPVMLGFALLLVTAVRAPRSLGGWAFALAALVPLAVDARTDTAEDYYRYWAGAARRMGDQTGARAAYHGLLEVDPSSEYAHFHLGNLERGQGNLQRALDHYTAAKRSAAPGNTRAAVAETEVRAMIRRVDGAVPVESPAPVPDEPDDQD